MKRLATILVAAVALTSFGAVVAWALISTLTVPPPQPEAEYATVQATSGTVESSIDLNANASWSRQLVGTNRAAGTVTSINFESGSEADQGEVLFTVDLRPVSVASGNVPAFRDIGEGSEGEDVAQLQEMLDDLNFYTGKADGKVGPRTIAAIKAWQKSVSIPQDGVVRTADLIFVPALPQRLVINSETISRGLVLVGAEEAVQQLSPEPVFLIRTTADQAISMPAGTRVEITSSQSVWNATVVAQTNDPLTGTTVTLGAAAPQASICGAECSSVPVTGETLLPSAVVIEEPVSGTMIPTSALQTDSAGSVYVVVGSGEERAVEVQQSARGMAVVTGIEPGEAVRVETDGADTP